jgi:hypothetical protein
MRPGPVVVVEVLAKDLDQVALVQDDQPIQTLSPQGAQYPLVGGVARGLRNGVRAIRMPGAWPAPPDSTSIDRWPRAVQPP